MFETHDVRRLAFIQRAEPMGLPPGKIVEARARPRATAPGAPKGYTYAERFDRLIALLAGRMTSVCSRALSGSAR